MVCDGRWHLHGCHLFLLFRCPFFASLPGWALSLLPLVLFRLPFLAASVLLRYYLARVRERKDVLKGGICGASIRRLLAAGATMVARSALVSALLQLPVALYFLP